MRLSSRCWCCHQQLFLFYITEARIRRIPLVGDNTNKVRGNSWTIDHGLWTQNLRVQAIAPAFGYVTAAALHIKGTELNHAATVIHRVGVYFAFIIRIFTIGSVADG